MYSRRYCEGDTLSLLDEFCGGGGSSLGATKVPGVNLVFAANHWPTAIETHAANFPNADHYCADIAAADITGWPACILAWHSPACPPWSNARGKRRDFDAQSAQLSLFGDDPEYGDEPLPDAATKRSRALMEEIPRYLAACALRGAPVMAGAVENVVEVVFWAEFGRWRREIEALGYRTRLIALNSMHAHGPRSLRAPQSRDRFFLAYWHRSLRRDPDWDKWLRPRAYCASCDRTVDAVQVFKKPGQVMGRYNAQYIYQCPDATCRRRVEPEILSAASAIDWSDLGHVIGERKKPLADKTMARIRAGFEKYALPFTVPTGGSWRSEASPVDAAHPTLTTRESDGLVVPALALPMEGREGKVATPLSDPWRTFTARAENAAVFPASAFLSALRGGGSKAAVYPVTGSSPTITASGNHVSLTVPGPGGSILVPYYGNGRARPVDGPVGTVPTRDRWSLATMPQDQVDRLFADMIAASRFRMLHDYEVQAVMAFNPEYKITGSSKRVRVRQLGNAVTPPCSEIIVSALVECLTGEELERYPQLTAI